MTAPERILHLSPDGTSLTVDGPLLAESDPMGHFALCEWCVTHGLDPHQMPGRQTIERDVERCRVVYDLVVNDPHAGRPSRDEDVVVRRVHAQGETPPLPWPSILTCLDCAWVETRALCERFPNFRRVPCEEHR
jgi:hypothetical protein